MRYFKILYNGEPYIEGFDIGPEETLDLVAAGYEGGTLIAETAKIPDEFETVQDDGSITTDTTKKVDTQAGREHIKEVRMMKTLEATMILSGANLTHGFLAEEAAARGVPLTQLAQQVYDQSQTFRDKELNRRLTKLGLI